MRKLLPEVYCVDCTRNSKPVKMEFLKHRQYWKCPYCAKVKTIDEVLKNIIGDKKHVQKRS